MLPSPLTFTIPSVHDDTVLDCRLYFPNRIDEFSPSKEWRKKAAVIAHPYGPLGGSFDDPIVEIVAKVLLKQEFIIGTFNFRGAGGSQGRTSWTSKPETQDYTSFVGFMTYFMDQLTYAPKSLLTRAHTADSFEIHDLSPIPSHTLPPVHSQMAVIDYIQSPKDLSSNYDTKSEQLLLLAGYSYGALVTKQLPPLDILLESFQTPQQGTAASEIRLRANQLSKQQNEAFALRLAAFQDISDTEQSPEDYLSVRGRSIQGLRQASGSSNVRIGGEETDPDVRRASHESRRSFSLEAPERLRRSMDKVRSIGRHSHGHISSPARQTVLSSTNRKDRPEKETTMRSSAATGNEACRKVETGGDSLNQSGIKVAYLLVSPLQGLITNLATMWTSQSLPSKPRSSNDMSSAFVDERKLIVNDALAVFGDEDIFSSSKKLLSWGKRLSSIDNSHFQYVEVSGAGHFWHEDGVAATLRKTISGFVEKL